MLHSPLHMRSCMSALITCEVMSVPSFSLRYTTKSHCIHIRTMLTDYLLNNYYNDDDDDEYDDNFTTYNYQRLSVLSSQTQLVFVIVRSISTFMIERLKMPVLHFACIYNQFITFYLQQNPMIGKIFIHSEA